MPAPYGYRWRAVTRPRTLLRSGGRFDGAFGPDGTPIGRYMGGAQCEKCRWIEHAVEKRSRIEIAHLDGDHWNDADENLACLCQNCHKKQDYKQWAARCKETRALRKDQKRPLLVEAGHARAGVILFAEGK